VAGRYFFVAYTIDPVCALDTALFTVWPGAYFFYVNRHPHKQPMELMSRLLRLFNRR